VAEERSVVAPPPQQPAAAVANRRILVVEDDPDVRLLVQQALHDAQYQVVTAQGGEEALAIASQAKTPFDLVLTDVVMKGLNGRELVDRLHAVYPQLPVIFMSGHTDDSVLRRGVMNDELSLLQKPFKASQLLQRVQQVLAERTT
jgi:CheY-like chemotaxis protein